MAGPSQYLYGLLARRVGDVTAVATKIQGFVHEINWSDAQPTAGDTNTIATSVITALDNSITLAENNGYNGIRVRIFCGADCPSWVKDLGAGPISNWVDPVDGGTFTIPAWWDASFISAYSNFIQALASVFSTRTNYVRDVTISGGCTVYAEPAIKQFSNATNRSNALAAGFTNQGDIDAQKAFIDIHHQYLSPLGIASLMSFNPWQTIGSGGGILIDNDVTVEIMDYMTTALGPYGIWQNNSAASSVSGGTYPTSPGTYTSQRGADDSHYQEMYDKMSQANGAIGTNQHAPSTVRPVGIQTATRTKIINDFAPATPGATAEWVDWVLGGLAVEMPAGWNADVTQTEADAINSRLQTRAQELIASNGGGSVAPTVRSSTGGTFAGVAGTTGFATSLPAGATAGDVLYLEVGFSANGTQVGTVTAGGGDWTAVTTNPLNSTSSSGVVLRRVMQAGDSAPTVNWSSNTSSGAWTMTAVQGADTTTPEDDTDGSTSSSASTSHIAPASAPTTPNTLMLCFAMGDNPGAGVTGTYTAPGSMTELQDRGSVNAGFCTVASEAITATGSTGTRTFTSSASVAHVTASVTVRGAPPATTEFEGWGVPI